MKSSIFILLVILSSCNSSQENGNAPDSKKDELPMDGKINSTHSNDTIELIDNVINNNVIQDSILVENIQIEIASKNFCRSIKEYLKKVNWRKHSEGTCYVVNLDENVQISDFETNIYSLRICAEKMKESDIFSLFGKPIRIIERKRGVYYYYPYVKYDSLSMRNQLNVQYAIIKKEGLNGGFEFTERTIVDSPPTSGH